MAWLPPWVWRSALALSSALVLNSCSLFGPELPEDPLPEGEAEQLGELPPAGAGEPTPARGKGAELYGDPESEGELVPEIDVEVEIEPVQEAEVVVVDEPAPDPARQPERAERAPEAEPDPDLLPERKPAPEPRATDAPEPRAEPLTPMDQSSAPSDIEITRRIRWAVVHDDSLSFDAHNIAIITIDGVVTLRGLVHSRTERDRIIALVRTVGDVELIRDRLIIDD